MSVYVYAQGQVVLSTAGASIVSITDGVDTWQIHSNGEGYVGGGVADNAVDSGNPVKTGGKYNLILPTYGDGDRADSQSDSRGRRIVTDDQVLSELVTIRGHIDGIEALIALTNGYVDGVEALIASTNTKLDTVNTNLSTIDGRVDGIEALIALTNGYVDGLEALITSTNGYVDGIEGLITSTNTKLDTLNAGKTPIAFATIDYATLNITTGAYVHLGNAAGKTFIKSSDGTTISSIPATVKEIEIFDSSGQSLYLAIGAAAAEINKLMVFPGGNGRIPLALATNDDLSLKAFSATANAGNLLINFYG